MDLKLEEIEEIRAEKIVKGKPIKIGDRTIYPLIKVSTVEYGDKFTFESILPIAIGIIETENEYLIYLNDDAVENCESPEADEIWKGIVNGNRSD
jgi:hypothetical protein